MHPERSMLAPALLAVVGVLALLATPATLFQPHYGQTAYDFGVERVERHRLGVGGRAFDELPSGAQRAFLRGVSEGGRVTLWVDDRAANETVSSLRPWATSGTTGASIRWRASASTGSTSGPRWDGCSPSSA